jgi:uncharacterized protein DUF1839
VTALAPSRGWTRHALHGEAGDPWPVSNCYADLWIELLWWLGFDPVPGFSHCFAVDYEERNWTFHKLPLRDLYTLYRLDVGELNVWLPLEQHVEEQLRRDCPVLIEADSYFLPDTAATTYRTRHQKTTIAVVALDRDAARMTFFHDNGRHVLEGEDYEGIFRNPDERNPLLRYAEALPRELAALQDGEFDFYDWAFSTVRQAGSAYQYAAAFCHAAPAGRLRAAGEHFGRIAGAMKALMMHVARASRRGRLEGQAPHLADAANHWELAIDAVRAGL